MGQRGVTRPPPATVADYFTAEAASPVRHAFRGGRIIAMAGRSEQHVLIASNIGGELRTRPKGSPCRSDTADLRVFAPSRQGGYCSPA